MVDTNNHVPPFGREASTERIGSTGFLEFQRGPFPSLSLSFVLMEITKDKKKSYCSNLSLVKGTPGLVISRAWQAGLFFLIIFKER
jgi:hypothetical protein